MNRALIFAHYDKHDIIDEHALFSLRNYRQYFKHIVFVSVSRINRQELLKLRFLADVVILRDNIGYDFCSWKIGLRNVDFSLYDEIVIANDSVYGPICDIANFFERSQSNSADIWGASISEQFQPHVQSFFVLFKKRFFQSVHFQNFWHSVVPISNKLDMIMAYELGLSSFARERGFTVDALVHFGPLDEQARRQCALENNMVDVLDAADKLENHPLFEEKPNPMQLYWGHAFRLGMPFVKVEVMRENPLNNNHAFIIDSTKKGRIYDVQLIHKHLRRIHAKI